MVVMSRYGSMLSREFPGAVFETEVRRDEIKPASERQRSPTPIVFRPSPAALESLPDLQSPAAQKITRIGIKANGRIVLIDPTEIIVAEAQGNYVLLQLSRSAHLLRGQISGLADKLEPYGLIRIHRSVLVNAAHVEDMEPLCTGEYLLRMKGGKEYKVTRTYRKNLQLFAATWIGMGAFACD